MATRYSIQMDFEKAERQAKELDEIADRLEKTANVNLVDTLNALGREWKGENASMYIKKGYVLKENIGDTAKSLQKAASTVRAVAKKIYNTEMENLRIAEERQKKQSQSVSYGKASGGNSAK